MRTFALLLGMAGAALAQENAPHPGVDQKKVDAAIERGVKWLLGPDNKPFAIKLNENVFGLDELQLYTLIHAGADREGERFKGFLRTAVEGRPEKTYSAALAAMSLQALDPVKYQQRLAQLCQFLVDNQCESGQWSYGEPTVLPAEFENEDPVKALAAIVVRGTNKRAMMKRAEGQTGRALLVRRQRKGPAKGDHSNSQYAALGLRACMEAKVYPPRETLELAKKGWELFQRQDGSWVYDDIGKDSPGSMTAGAAGSLAIYTHWLGGNWEAEPSVLRGFKWLNLNFSVKEAPRDTRGGEYFYYYLYAVERVAMLTGLAKYGGHDWYREGANHLLDLQKADGTWTDKAIGGTVHGTCFAILFLRRATIALPKVATIDVK